MPLAKALSDVAINPVMLLYIYDGDFWGYDFYGGQEEAHFSTLPELRQRIQEGGIIEFDACDTSHTVLRDDGTYSY